MCVEDIIKKHTLPVENGKSYNISRDIKYLKNIMLQILTKDDVIKNIGGKVSSWKDTPSKYGYTDPLEDHVIQ